MRVVPTLILVLSMAGSAVAHDMFLMPERFRTANGETLTLGIHSGDGFPDSTQLPLRLTNAFAHTGGNAAGLEVKAASTAPGSKPEVIGKTDANGMISVKLTSAGPWRLHAILMQRSPDASADWESFWSTLTFEIP